MEKAVAEVKKSMESKETDKIKKALETLQKEVYDMSAKIYKESGHTPPPPGNESPKSEEGKTVDADFEVKEDK